MTEMERFRGEDGPEGPGDLPDGRGAEQIRRECERIAGGARDALDKAMSVNSEQFLQNMTQSSAE